MKDHKLISGAYYQDNSAGAFNSMNTSQSEWGETLKELLAVEITDEDLRLRLEAVIGLLIERTLRQQQEELVKFIEEVRTLAKQYPMLDDKGEVENYNRGYVQALDSVLHLIRSKGERNL